MRKLVLIALALLLWPATAQAMTAYHYRVDVTAGVNAFRHAHGRRRLRFGYRLQHCAREESLRIASMGLIDHGDWISRIRSCGVRASWIGETLAVMPGGPQEVIQGWEQSPEHRAVMLTRPFRRVGVSALRARGRWWVTADFSSG